jgi:hypothetical protein
LSSFLDFVHAVILASSFHCFFSFLPLFLPCFSFHFLFLRFFRPLYLRLFQSHFISSFIVSPSIASNESKHKKLRGLSPRANYIDRATAAYRRN